MSLPSLFSKPLTSGMLTALRAKAQAQPHAEPQAPAPVVHRAVKRIALVTVHHCPECNRETEVNCGQFVEFAPLRGQGDTALRTRVLRASEWKGWEHLTSEIEILGIDERECPRCLGLRPQESALQLSFAF